MDTVHCSQHLPQFLLRYSCSCLSLTLLMFNQSLTCPVCQSSKHMTTTFKNSRNCWHFVSYQLCLYRLVTTKCHLIKSCSSPRTHQVCVLLSSFDCPVSRLFFLLDKECHVWVSPQKPVILRVENGFSSFFIPYPHSSAEMPYRLHSTGPFLKWWFCCLGLLGTFFHWLRCSIPSIAPGQLLSRTAISWELPQHTESGTPY